MPRKQPAAAEKAPATQADGEKEPQEPKEQNIGGGSHKIRMLAGYSEDLTAVTFQIQDESHTLGNSLRYIIMKNPNVEFCGYSIPHPSEPKLNLRIQVYGEDGKTAVDALEKGLDDLMALCAVVEDNFREAVQEKKDQMDTD